MRCQNISITERAKNTYSAGSKNFFEHSFQVANCFNLTYLLVVQNRKYENQN